MNFNIKKNVPIAPYGDYPNIGLSIQLSTERGNILFSINNTDRFFYCVKCGINKDNEDMIFSDITFDEGRCVPCAKSYYSEAGMHISKKISISDVKNAIRSVLIMQNN